MEMVPESQGGLKSVADINLSLVENVLRNNALESRGEDNAIVLRKILLQEVLKENSKAENGWVLAAVVAERLHTKVASESFRAKQVYKEAREFAIKKGWLEKGRRRLQDPRKGAIVATNVLAQGYSKDEFLRVISFSGIVSQRPKASPSAPNVAKLASTRLFVKKFPEIPLFLTL